MKKFILGAILFLATIPAFAFECQTDNPYHSEKVVSVCHTAYQAFIDVDRRIPLMVHYEINPKNELSCALRTGSFKADPALPKNEQGSKADYSGGGYDIGHMFPAEDGLYDPDVEDSTFRYINAVPQAPSFNRGKWKQLETRNRDWSEARGDVLDVYAGPILNHIIDGTGNLPVPGEFYKIIIDRKTGEAMLFRMSAPRADVSWHGTITDADLVTSLPEVPVDLKGLKIVTHMWAKPRHNLKNCP